MCRFDNKVISLDWYIDQHATLTRVPSLIESPVLLPSGQRDVRPHLIVLFSLLIVLLFLPLYTVAPHRTFLGLYYIKSGGYNIDNRR